MRSGFTIIELLFVIVIIGILTAVAIPKLKNKNTVDADSAMTIQTKDGNTTIEDW